MTEAEIQNILEKQHKFFQTGQTLPVAYRIEQLQKLKDSITRHEPDLNLALKADLGKSETESYMCEIGLTLSELSWMLKHIKKLDKRNGTFRHHWHSLQPKASALLPHTEMFSL